MNPTPIQPKATYQGGEALPMVGTAEYNQSLNLANQAGAGNLSSPTPSGFSISIPETIPSSSMASSNSTGDLFNYRSLIESQQNSYNDYLNSISELNQSLGQFMQPSETEQDLTGQLNALNQSERQGLLDTENKVIPMSFITGQQASIQRQAGIDRQALSEQLGTVQSQRQAGLEAINQQIQIAQSQYNAGVDMNNNLMKIQQLMDEKSKMETQVVQLDNGSTVLVNTQTGEVIKTLAGATPTTGGGFGSDFGFGMGGFDTTEQTGGSFEEWLAGQEQAQGMSFDTGNPQVMEDLQAQYQEETGGQTTSSFVGQGGLGQIESFILRNVTDKDAGPVLEAFNYGYQQAPDKDLFVKDYITSYLKPKDMENYNSAQGIELALSPVSMALETGEFKSGPFVSAQQRLLRTIGKSNPYYESIKTLFSKGKAEERLRLFGASLTTGEQSSARDFLPDEKDNSATLKFKVDTMINLSKLSQERTLKQAVGLPMSQTVAGYIAQQKKLLADTQNGITTPSNTSIPSTSGTTTGTDYRTIYGYN